MNRKLLPWLVALAASSAWAGEPSAELTYHFEIEPQTLRTAIPLFARQANIGNFAMSDGKQATQIKVNRVSGTLTRNEALRRMLESTGVTYSMRRPNLIVFQVPSPPSSSPIHPK